MCISSGSWYIVSFICSLPCSYTVTLKDNNSFGRNLTLKQRGVLRLSDLSERDKRSIDYLKACVGYCELTDNDNSSTEQSVDMTGDYDGGGGDSDDCEDIHSSSQTSFIDQYNQRRRPLAGNI